MKKYKAVILDGYCENPGDLSWDEAASMCDLTVYDRTPENEILTRSAGADILVVNKTPLRKETLEALPDVKFIAVLATGYNIVDTQYCRERNIPVSNIPAYSTDTVAQYVFAFILEHASRVALHTQAVRDGEWTACPDFSFQKAPVHALAGKTLGIYGFGRIGQRVAAIAHAFGMNICVCTAHPEKYDFTGENFVNEDTLARTSDFLTLHCPLTEATRGLIDGDFLAKMKKDAFLVNTARGQVIDETALADALNEEKIAGAGLDVLSSEPPEADNPLLTAKNCYITPHIAWASTETRIRLMEIFNENLRGFLDGKPIHVVNM